MKYTRYCLQFLIALIAVVFIAGHPGYFSQASPTIAQTLNPNPLVDSRSNSPVDSRSAIDTDTLLERTRTEPKLCPADLESAISRIIDTPTLAGSQWGILVEPLSSEEVLYSHHADQFLIPASNIKLLTTSAALQTATLTSSRLSEIEWWVSVINRDSDNYYADTLLNQIGGPEAVRQALAPLGIDPYSYRQVDGSGLSRDNIVKPTTFVALLKAMRSASGSDVFYNSLPVAGINGTLSDRFQGTVVQGKVHAKTGTLRGVKALSGYLEHPDYEMLVFSIVVNQPGQSGYVLSGAIDQIVLQLAQLSRCE